MFVNDCLTFNIDFVLNINKYFLLLIMNNGTICNICFRCFRCQWIRNWDCINVLQHIIIRFGFDLLEINPSFLNVFVNVCLTFNADVILNINKYFLLLSIKINIFNRCFSYFFSIHRKLEDSLYYNYEWIIQKYTDRKTNGKDTISSDTDPRPYIDCPTFPQYSPDKLRL